MERFVVISADCHAVGRPEEFVPYLDAEYREAYEASVEPKADSRRDATASEDGGLLFSRESLDEYHSHEETADVTGGTAGQWDSERRIAELEDDGVVAEVVFPNGGPFVTGRGGAPFAHELQVAGLLAYNRWLADFCAQAPGRRAGVAQLPIHDVDLAVHEIETAAAAGLKGVSVPILFDDAEAAPLYHERYEPMWAACAEHAMPVHVHGGAGPDYGDGIDQLTRIMLYVTEVPMWPRRILTFLLWNGTLARHPDLRLVFTEGTSDWVPAQVSYLDYLYESKDFAHIRQVLPLKPSEYWRRQCFVGASSVSRGRDRHALRHRRRQHDVRLRLPPRRRNVAAHLRLGAGNARRHPGARATHDPGRERGALVRLRRRRPRSDRAARRDPGGGPRVAPRQHRARAHTGRPAGSDVRPRLTATRAASDP